VKIHRFSASFALRPPYLREKNPQYPFNNINDNNNNEDDSK
jgi:hypothetical protein